MSHLQLNFSIATLMAFLRVHGKLAYVVLFFGSYFETVVGISFFVYGEFFFLAGSILAGAHVLNIFWVTGVLVLGGVAGDSTSYWIGHHYGVHLFKEKRRFLNLENYEKGKNLFHKYGLKAIFFARLLGPVSWITPFFAGIAKVRYSTFLFYNIPGIFVGIGQFIVVGYLFGSNFSTILPFVHRYVEVILICFALIFGVWVYIKKHKKEQ